MSGFGRILEDLNAAEVDYVLVGGIALIRHGVIRATRDVDAVFAPTEENVARIKDLVGRWKATRPDGSPVQIAEICSLVDLVALKRLAGRERDIADLSDLEAAHGDLPTSGS